MFTKGYQLSWSHVCVPYLRSIDVLINSQAFRPEKNNKSGDYGQVRPRGAPPYPNAKRKAKATTITPSIGQSPIASLAMSKKR